MFITELFEASYSPDLLFYHFCTGENLRSILEQNIIKSSTEHLINDKKHIGISLTRDRTLNLLKTYASSGVRCFRIGLNVRKLQMAGHKLIPVRDDYLRQHHKAKQLSSGVMTSFTFSPKTIKVDSNEAEELLIPRRGVLLNAKSFMDEIALDNRLMFRYDGEQDGNKDTYDAIMAGTFGTQTSQNEYEIRLKHGGYKLEYDGNPINLPKHIRFIETDNDYAIKHGDIVVESIEKSLPMRK